MESFLWGFKFFASFIVATFAFALLDAILVRAMRGLALPYSMRILSFVILAFAFAIWYFK